MPCFFCKDEGLVLVNTYAGDIQPMEEELTVEDEGVIYDKKVACHVCSDGGPAAEPDIILVPRDEA